MREHWREAGIEVLLLPRVVETMAQRESYAQALGEPVRVVRIDASPAIRHARLLARHDPGPERDWHLARTDVLADLLVAAGVEDVVVTNDDWSPPAVAAQVVELLGY
jgi:dephospho-CoA kinase